MVIPSSPDELLNKLKDSVLQYIDDSEISNKNDVLLSKNKVRQNIFQQC